MTPSGACDRVALRGDLLDFSATPRWADIGLHGVRFRPDHWLLVEGGRVRELQLTRVDGEPVATSPWKTLLVEAGFAPGYRGYVLRPGARGFAGGSPGLRPAIRTADEYLRRGPGRA